MNESVSTPSEAGPPAGLGRFLARFERGEFWLAHEELEEVWLEDRRDTYKGLIQIAAACLHRERDNDHGVRAKLTGALQYIGNDETEIPWVDRAGLVRLIEQLLEGEWPARIDLREFVSVSPDDDGVESVELPYRVTRYAQGYRTGRDPKRRD